MYLPCTAAKSTIEIGYQCQPLTTIRAPTRAYHLSALSARCAGVSDASSPAQPPAPYPSPSHNSPLMMRKPVSVLPSRCANNFRDPCAHASIRHRQSQKFTLERHPPIDLSAFLPLCSGTLQYLPSAARCHHHGPQKLSVRTRSCFASLDVSPVFSLYLSLFTLIPHGIDIPRTLPLHLSLAHIFSSARSLMLTLFPLLHVSIHFAYGRRLWVSNHRILCQ